MDPQLEQALRALSPDLDAAALAKAKKLRWDPYSGSGADQGDDDSAALAGPIVRLEGLEVCTGLTKLELEKSQVSDLSPVRALTKLKELNLSGNLVVDLTPLARLDKLEVLYLNGNASLTDVTPLAGLQKLKTLYLAGTKTKETSSLAGLSALETLSLSESDVSDVTPLAGLQKLKMLVLRDCKSLVVEPGSANDATLRKLIDAGVDVYIKSEHIEAYKKAKASS